MSGKDLIPSVELARKICKILGKPGPETFIYELFLDDSWGQVMLGQGVQPQGWSPLADNVPAEDLGPFLASLSRACRVKAQALPRHADFISGLVGAA